MRTSVFSHCGNHQSENQDCIYINENVVVIADGMGGLPRAGQAARFAAKKAAEYLYSEVQRNEIDEMVIERILTVVNEELCTQFPGSGTTLSTLLAQKETIWCGNVGDSKSYALQDDLISKISVDQNLAEKSGLSLHRNILTSYIGLADRLPAFIQRFPLIEGSTYVLCTDGVTDSVDLQLLLAGQEKSSPEIIGKLIETAAHDANPKDNYSAVVIRT